MPTPAKLELTLKISALPDDARPAKNDWTRFTVQDEASGLTFDITCRPKVWNKLLQAQADWPSWVAAITGTLGPKTSATGYILSEPAIQVFERKPRPEKADAPAEQAAPPPQPSH